MKNAGYNIKLVDSNFMKINPYLIIENFKPNVVGIYCSSYNYSFAIKIAKFAKEIGSIVVVGGPHVSLIQEEILKNQFVDFGIIGDGEYSFLKLINSLDKNQNTHNIPGLIFREDKK